MIIIEKIYVYNESSVICLIKMATHGQKTLQVQRLSATTGVSDKTQTEKLFVNLCLNAIALIM
jgi:hypothetical protein